MGITLLESKKKNNPLSFSAMVTAIQSQQEL